MGYQKYLPVALGVATAAIYLALNPQVATQAQRRQGDAPNFSGVASDGKTYSLASLKQTKKPTLLYFIGSTCPVNAQAVKFYNAMAESYKGKVNVVGIIDTDKAGYKTWQTRFKAPYPVVYDPDLKIIKSYGAERSPWTILVDSKGKIVEEWHGYSVSYLKQTNEQLATLGKIKPKPIVTAGAPEDTRYG